MSLTPERSTKAAGARVSAQSLALSFTETATGAKRVLHFRDERPPQEIQFTLERDLMVLFKPTIDNGGLMMVANAKLVGAHYFFELRFDEALLGKNCYSLRVETSWDEQAVTHHDYYRKTSASWFSFWTRHFLDATPPAAGAGSRAHYQKLCDAALQAEVHLDNIPALQQAIVAAMKQGAFFSDSHKEGDTRIYWRDGNFVRSDSGDYPRYEKFSSEHEFLTSLRMFYDLETSKNIYPNKASDFEAWKLILRLLQTT